MVVADDCEELKKQMPEAYETARRKVGDLLHCWLNFRFHRKAVVVIMLEYFIDFSYRKFSNIFLF